MSPYYLNFPPGSQASGDGHAQPPQSIGQNFRVPSSLQAFASEDLYLSTASQQSYSFLDQDCHGTSQAPQTMRINSARLFRPSLGSRSIRTPLSLSSHPYHQARLYHIADRVSAQHQEWSRLPFPTVPAPAPASSAVIPYNAMIGNRASTHCHNSSQLSLIAKKFAPPSTFGSVSQSDIMAPNTDQNMPSLTGSLTVSEQLLSTYQTQTPASPPYIPADQADIEYARYHYGDKRCFYQCRFDLHGSPCNKWIVGDRTRVLRHLRNHHHLQTGPATPAICRWDECTHSPLMKQENLARHVVTHLGVKWKCPHCKHLFSRDDAVHRHVERMVPGVDITDAEVVPGPEARAMTEPQFKRARIT